MTTQMERLKALVVQLIARLEHEKSENRRLASQLAAREAELGATKEKCEEMRTRAEAILKAFRQTSE